MMIKADDAIKDDDVITHTQRNIGDVIVPRHDFSHPSRVLVSSDTLPIQNFMKIRSSILPFLYARNCSS
jgi:hypothetical protein